LRIRGVSIDLWFTLVYDDAERYRLFQRSRIDYIYGVLKMYRDDVSREDLEGLFEEFKTFMMEVHPYRLMQMVAAALGIDSEAVDEMYSRYVDAAWNARPYVNPDALRFLEWCEEMGLPVVITTNTTYSREMISRMFSNIGLEKYVDRVVSSAEVGAAKPKPRIFREAVGMLGLDPKEVLHVGDKYVHDALGAYLAGLRPALYRGLWDKYGRFMGFGEGFEVRSYPPYIWVVDSFDELIGRLERLVE